MKKIVIAFSSLLTGVLVLVNSSAASAADTVALMVRTDGVFLKYDVDARHALYAGVHYFQSKYESRNRGLSPDYSSPGIALGYRFQLAADNNMRPHIDTLLAYSNDRNEANEIFSDDSTTRGLEFGLAYGVEYHLAKSVSIEAKVGLLYTHDKTTGRIERSSDNGYAPVTVVGFNFYF